MDPYTIYSAAWNRVKNVSGFSDDQGATAPIAAPTKLPDAHTTVTPAQDSSLHYYVRFTAYNGQTVTFAGTLFELDSFKLSDTQTLNIGSQATGAGAGKVTFDPLQLSFTQAGLDPTLFRMLASGTPFREVDILGYKGNDDSSVLAVDYSFGLVGVQNLTTDQTGQTDLTLQYGSQEIQEFKQQPDGTVSPSTSAAWNRVKNVSGFSDDQGATAPIAAPTKLPDAHTTVTPAQDSSLHYYVRFTAYNGQTVTFAGTLFELDSFKLSDTQTLNIGSQATGAGAGKVTFDPLQLSFTQAGLDPTLFRMLASGTPFREVDILGYKGNDDSSVLAVDYSFGLVGVQNLTTDQTGQTDLTLQYGSQEIQEFKQQPDGTVSPSTSAAWNRVKNVSGFSDDQGATAPIAAPTKLPDAHTTVTPAQDSSLHYYVRFTAYNGQTVTFAGTLFELDSFKLSDTQTLNIGSQATGAGAGKVTFDPLQLSFTQAGLDPTLFRMLASGTPFREVDILGYKGNDDSSVLAVDYSFGLVGVQNLTTDQTGQTDLTLQYGSQEIQEFKQQPDGTVSPSTSAAWNRVKNVSGFSDDQGATAPIAAPTKLPDAHTTVTPAQDSSLHYYVRFTAYNGQTVTFAGTLFELDSFKLSDTQTLNIGSQATGAGAGKVTFDPLQLSFTQAGLDPTLFRMLASGTPFREVDILGYKGNDDSSVLAVDYSFGLVGVQNLTTDQTGQTDLTLQYGSQEIQEFKQQPDGTVSPSTSAAWNRVKNVSGFSDDQGATAPIAAPTKLPDAHTTVTPAQDSSLHYYVRFTAYNGQTVTFAGTLFELDSFKLSDTQTLNIGSQATGAGAGKVTFDPLQLSFTQAGLDPTLFRMLASGTPFREVDILGYKGNDDSSVLAVDYSFGLVGVQNLTTDQTGQTDLTLQYGSQEIQEFKQQPDGTVSPSTSAAWNRVKNVSGFSDDQGATAPIAAPTKLPDAHTTVTPAQDSSLHYYVRFTAYNGQTVTFAGTLFELDSFKLSDTQTLNIGSQATGAGAGKVTFDPLQLSFTQAGLDPTLFRMLASGTPFREVDILGYKGNDDSSVLAVDYSFGLVGVQNLTTGPTGQTNLTLEYGSQEIQEYIYHPATLAATEVLTTAREHVAITAGTTVATFTDTNTTDLAGDFTASISWGDGTTTAGAISGSNGNFTVAAGAGGHTYANEGTDALSVTVTRTSDGNNTSATGNVVVGNNDFLTGHGTTISTVTGRALSNVTVATFTDTDLVSTASGFVATINWGDGTAATAGTVSGSNGNFTVTGNHTYASLTTGAVTVTLSERAPGTATATATSTATVDILLGDANGNGVQDNGETTLLVPYLAAQQFLGASETGADVRISMMKQALLAQEGIDSGKADPGLFPGQPAGHDLITEAVSWLKGIAPFTYSPFSTNVDTNKDGVLQVGASAGSGVEYNTTTQAFTSPLQKATMNSWTQYVDTINTTPQTGDILINGQDLRNALVAFNTNQLATLMAGNQVAWNNGGTISDVHANTANTFLTVLADNHVIAAPPHA